MYFDCCPNWQVARTQLRHALDRLGRVDVPIREVQVEAADEGVSSGFVGSPTILVDGKDLFPRASEWSGGLACRLYPTPTGSGGSPRTEDIMSALTERV